MFHLHVIKCTKLAIAWFLKSNWECYLKSFVHKIFCDSHWQLPVLLCVRYVKIFCGIKDYLLFLHRDRVNCLETLIAYGADVNSVNYNQLSPLHMAVRKGHRKCIEVLLRNNCSTNLKVWKWLSFKWPHYKSKIIRWIGQFVLSSRWLWHQEAFGSGFITCS